MSEATSLRDLLQIRAANRDLIDSINGNLGSALGFKKPTGEAITDQPAVLIFVPEKIEDRWLPQDQRIPKILHGPNGLICPTDVVAGSIARWPLDPKLRIYQNNYPTSGWWTVHWSSLVSDPPISEDNVNVLELLHGWSEEMFAGSRLTGFNSSGEKYSGTAGCFVIDRTTGNRGILTNHHVADHLGNVLYFPSDKGKLAGTVRRLFDNVHDQERFSGIIDEPGELYHVDCAFLEIHADIADNTNRELPRLGRIGPPLPLDLDTMGPLGRRVASVGQRRGVQYGSIAAFSYEYTDDPTSLTYYTDYLIIGDGDLDEDGREITTTAFSDNGDSGKIIVTDDENHNAIALLWGGKHARLRSGKMQEKWSYAIDINYVLELLDLEIDS